MKNLIKSNIKQGKKKTGNLKVQRIINILVMIGFGLFTHWYIFLLPKTFVKPQLLFALAFLPSIAIAIFLNKKILTACGYSYFIKKAPRYTVIVNILSYLLIMIFVGNLTLSVFLQINLLFTHNKSETYILTPKDPSISTSRRSNSTYTHFDLEFKGITKQINRGDTPLKKLQQSQVEIEVDKGFFGYYVINKIHLIDK